MNWSWTSQRWLVAFLAEIGTVAVACWVRRQERTICEQGEPLTETELNVARLIGIQFPERVRIQAVEEIPFPFDWLARRLASLTGRFPARALGLTARYGIYVQAGVRWDAALLVHELVHTAQYERFGGIAGFLREYLKDCLRNGYDAAVMEQEARNVSSNTVIPPSHLTDEQQTGT